MMLDSPTFIKFIFGSMYNLGIIAYENHYLFMGMTIGIVLLGGWLKYATIYGKIITFFTS